MMPAPTDRSDALPFIKRAVRFVLIGLLLYGLLYAAAEQLSAHHAKRNRFHAVKTAPQIHYDHVILGASRAAVFDYEDLNARLERMTNARILNLSVVGGGITVNRLLLDYFLTTHRTVNVVYVIDSFGFYSRDWNEARLQDTRLFVRAPFDPALIPLLLRHGAGFKVALDYVSGFSKINNPDRFTADVSEDEAVKFPKTYRPVPQIDKQRIEYLYPKQTDPQALAHYLAELETLIQHLKQHNSRLTVIKPPLPARVHAMLPNEAQFDNALKLLLERHGIAFHDFSLAGNDDKHFFNTDHLNRNGVLNFFENYLRAILAR